METQKVLMLLPGNMPGESKLPYPNGDYIGGGPIASSNGVDVYPAASVDQALSDRDEKIAALEQRLAKLEERLSTEK